jgi:hypothetical protein
MKGIFCLIVAWMVIGCAMSNADTLYPGLTITSATVAEPAGGRLVIPVFVYNNTDLWAQVYTTSSPIETGAPAYDQRIPYVSCSQSCIGQDLELADFFGIKPHSTASGIADEFNWSLNAPVGFKWTGLLDGEFHLSTIYLGPPLINGTFQIDFRAIVSGPPAPVPEPSTPSLTVLSLLALAVFMRTRRSFRPEFKRFCSWNTSKTREAQGGSCLPAWDAKLSRGDQ